MRVIAKSALIAFWEKNPEAKQPLLNWFNETCNSTWRNTADVRLSFATVSILKKGRAVFNIAGNKYRLVASIAFNTQVVFIKFVGTHSQYNRIDAQSVEYKG